MEILSSFSRETLKNWCPCGRNDGVHPSYG
jgi:hypothetical protein